MGETDGDVAAPEERASQEPSPAPDTLQVPTQKRRKKSPTPLGLRGRSATPIRGRSQTPFTLYMTRRSATPSTWRSITPFLKREEKEKTPFELGREIKTLLCCNKAVFDKALVMDITEPEIPPVHYITSDMSVIDRAAVMDVSNVEVIYVVEEYEEYTEEEEEEEIIVEEVKPKKKEKKPRKGRTPRKSADRERESTSPGRTDESVDKEGSEELDRERSESAEPEEKEKKKKKAAPKKKVEKKEAKVSLKLEMGPGAKASKKMFDQAPPQPPPRPPPKKSKIALQMEEQAKAAKLKAEEEAKRNAEKQKNETFEERQKRLKAEAEEKARIEALEAAARAQQEAEEAAQAAEEAAAEREAMGLDEEMGDEEEHEGDHEGDHEDVEDDDYAESNVSRDPDADMHEYDEDEAAEAADEFDENIKDKRRASKVSVDSFTRPKTDEELKWIKIAEEEGEEFMINLRKYSMAQQLSERDRDSDWQKRREQARLPHFINFLTDRVVEVGHNVRLACAVDGPDLSVKWFKDGKQLERDATHRIANNNNILTLEVVKTTQTDSGEYSCVIANTNDEITSTCIVTVYEVYKDEPSPPTFSLIRDYYHLHDDELTIECHIHGIPRPKVTWLFGAFELKPSFKFTLLEEAHGVYKLLIYRPSNKDSGKYTCKAVNESGEAQISHTIEVAKNKNFHVHGIFRARDRFSREKEATARQAMDEAMASKKESDRKRAGTVEPRAGGGGSRSSVNEPLVPPKNKLQIVTQLRDRIALEGATIKLFCNVIGPSPACRWMKDDNWIVVGPKIRNLSEEGKAVLELVKVTAEASGQYKLVAKNEYSEVDTSCFLRVYSAQTEGDEQEPMFALPIRDVYHSSENDLIIDTKVRGNPRPTISWFKDSQPVVLDDRIQQIEHLDGVCQLIINKPQPNDAGVYACEAVNSLGHTKQTHSVLIDQNIIQSRRSSGGSVKMVEESGDAGKGGQKAKRERKKEEDSGATYERKSRMPDPSPKMSLYFIGNMSNRYLAEGNRVKLQAVIGGPDPTMKWLKDGQQVVIGPKIRNLSRDGLAVLEFVKPTVEDSGTYTLIARNEACEISTTALLHIYKPDIDTDVAPVFVRSIKETYHLNTNELILETGARGQPKPIITWFKDSVEIKNDERIKIISHADGSSELVIDQPNEKDSGKYVVKAENSAGKAELLHQVLFKGKETHIVDHIHGVFHADKSLLKKKEEEKPAEPAEEKGKKGKKGKDEPEEILVIPDVPAKEEKREKRIGIHFKAHATDRCVAEGSRVKLTAFCECSETPAVKWTHDDQQVVFSQKVRQSYREGLCQLELVSVKDTDSGIYKCIAKDSNNEVTTSCKLEVYKRPGDADIPPTFTRAIKDSYHEKVNEVVLNCGVRGLPTPTITWVKDSVKIEPSDKYQMIYQADGTCELIISNPVPSDSGKYVCQAENSKDKAELTHVVHIEVRRKRASSPGRSIPAAAKAIAESKEAEDKEKKKEKKKKEDEEATSSRREVPPPPDLRKRLYLRNFLSNRTVPVGSTVRWVVNIDGPDPTARWYNKDQLIAFGSKSKLACQDGICWLQLIGVTEEQSGEIKLVVKGPENEVESTCNLFVYSVQKEEEDVAPVFTVGIKDTYSLNEDELVLDCRVRGYPRPEVQWMVGSDYIEPSARHRPISLSDGYCKLIINNPTEKDSGLYSCVARNSVKETKITHQLDFKGKDKVVFEKTHGFFHRDPNKPHLQNPLGNQTVTPGGTIAIMAEFLPTSSPIDVQWFRSREPLAGQPNVKTFHEKGVYTLAISNAQSEWEGTYTCRATNAFGKLETHANVDIAEKGGKAAGPPLFLSRPESEMKIAVGDPFSISFRLQGEPKPKLTLLKGTKDITKTDRVSKEALDDYIRFTVQKAQVPDSGTYFVVARNEYGTDRVFVTITVASDPKK